MGDTQTRRQSANESAATLNWLVARLGLAGSDAAGSVRSAWNEVRSRMRAASSGGQFIQQQVDWISDFWVARSAVPVMDQLAPAWTPPEDINHWPEFGVEEVVALFPRSAGRSNHNSLVEMVSATHEPTNADETARAALARYLELKSALAPRVFDIAAIQTEHVRAWLAASVGHLLMFAALAPTADPAAPTEEVLRRVGIAARVAAQRYALDLLGDRQLEVLYNARMRPDGNLSFGAVRIGQGEEWRDHWIALGFEIGIEDTLEAVRMAAKLLRCAALVLALTSAIKLGDARLKLLATAVLRRWLLTLQTMAWLEAALVHSWSDVRPQDLCCFALNATKPDWPRRVVAISHLSRDVKPVLRGMYVWREARIAIDANYAPSWETNVGMIWGLFAATPAIIRIRSPAYHESVWCRRERELTDYLLRQSDFLTKRWIIDLDQPDLKRLDAIVQVWNPQALTESRRLLPEFPPSIEVCSPTPMPAWEVRMLRASAALRVIHAVVPGATPEFVNRLALYLQSGGELPGNAPTNNPDNWRTYGEVFREAAEINGIGLGDLAVRLPNDYDHSQLELDLQMGQRIPDLHKGSPSLRDVLVAMEWLRVEYPQFVAQRGYDFLAINCQRFTKTAWENAEEVSLHRGLAAMRERLPVPLWIIQQAGQDIESWPLVGEVPIFTEHAKAQFGWMVETSFDRQESQRKYVEDSRMILAPALEARCRGRGG